MDFSAYNTDLRKKIAQAKEIASSLKHEGVEPEHLLLVLTQSPVVNNIIQQFKLSMDDMKDAIHDELSKLSQSENPARFITPRFIRVLSAAEALSDRMGSKLVSVSHILIALSDDSNFDGEIYRLFKSKGMNKEQVESACRAQVKARARAKAREKKGTELDKYTVDLVEKAGNGSLGPVVGRDEEIHRVIQILSRKIKNNPVLIGPPGVGKSAVIEALAIRIANKDVPFALQNKRILTLDLGSILAGATLRGQFEERIKMVINEVKSSAGEIILFIDEIHTMVGAGGEGASNASSMLKPALARGEIQVLGATTPEEYKNTIEKDKALERRFQSVDISEPSEDDTVRILRGIKNKFEVYHGVRIQDPALTAAVTLAKRYIPRRHLPDKAIDLIDEAASKLRIQIDSMPKELDMAERTLTHLKMELKALGDDSDSDTIEHKINLEVKIEEEAKHGESLRTRWQTEVSLIQKIRALTEELEASKVELENAERKAEANIASDIKYGSMQRLQEQLDGTISELEEAQRGGRLIKEEVDPEDIAEVVGNITGIPVNKMMENEREKLLQMEARIGKRVIGQKEALQAIAKAIRRSRVGLSDPNRPVGSFFFLGPTGVGKCLAPNTEVLCYDGSVIKAKNITCSTLLMGPDSTSRKVLSTTIGTGPMYRISPYNGEPWECNNVHVLTLKNVATGEIKDIPLDEYLKLGLAEMSVWRQFSTGVNFAKQEPADIDPYTLGTSLVSTFIEADDMSENASVKKIMTSSRQERLDFLAGAIDVNGIIADNSFKLIRRNDANLNIIAFVARSLGFNVVREDLHYSSKNLIKLTISNNIHLIPNRIEENKAHCYEQENDSCMTDFTVQSIGEGNYAGFTLDGDGRFLLADFTVTHNTELAKAITQFLFDDEDNLIRLDMSEFMEKHTIARLIGAPPGYKGADDGGQLTEAVKRKPYSVVLFDEVEKAHPDIFNILLQILDDGRLTDSQSNLVDFRNTVIIMTSNIGSAHLLDASDENGEIEPVAKESAMEDLRRHFRPEFLGRIDEVIMFHGLTRNNIDVIADLQIAKLRKLLSVRKLGLELTDDAKKFVVDAGYDPRYGARPLRRALQNHLQDPLSMELLNNNFTEGTTIKTEYDKEKNVLIFKGD